MEASARYSGAIQRRRKIQTALDLLRYLLVYSLWDCSLRMVGLWGTVMDLGSLSKTGLLKRLRKCRQWIGMLVVAILVNQRVGVPQRQGVRLRVLDATTVSAPGSHSADWRLHVSFDLGQGWIDDLQLTDGQQGETLTRWQFAPGDICLADRAYGVPRSLGVLLGTAAHFVIRIGWQNLPLQWHDGQPFAISDWLKVQSPDPQRSPAQTQVWVVTPQGRFAIRLLARAIPPEKAARIRRRLRQEAQRKKRKLDPRSLLAAGFVILASNLPETAWSATQLLELYHFRWQIELLFKRLKSILHFDHLRAKDPDLAQVYLLTKLFAALLILAVQQPWAETLTHSTSSPNRPLSLWRLTQLLFLALRQSILGCFSLSRLRLHWPQLSRYLSDEPRLRLLQFAQIQAFLHYAAAF